MSLWKGRKKKPSGGQDRPLHTDRVKRLDSGWQIDLDSEISRVCIDYALSLDLCSEGGDISNLRIEAPFQMRRGAITEEWDGEDIAWLGRFARLHKERVTAIGMTDGGTLTMTFANAARLIVTPHPAYESFNLLIDGWRFYGASGSGLHEYEPYLPASSKSKRW